MAGKLDLVDNDDCFACGKSNPIGLKLEFEEIDGEYVTSFTPRPEHQGYVDIVHGGIMSTILDEVMARYVHVLGHKAVTAEMTVRLKKAARVGQTLRFAGRIESENRRLIMTSATAVDDEGTLIAEAAARMMRVG